MYRLAPVKRLLCLSRTAPTEQLRVGVLSRRGGLSKRRGLIHVGLCTAGARDSDPHDPGIRHAGRSRLLGTFGGIFGSVGRRGRGGGRSRHLDERRRKGGGGERVLWRQGFRTWRQAGRTVRSLDASPCDSRFNAVHLDRVDLGSVRDVKRCDQHAGTAEEVGPVRLAYLATHVEERHPHLR